MTKLIHFLKKYNKVGEKRKKIRGGEVKEERNITTNCELKDTKSKDNIVEYRNCLIRKIEVYTNKELEILKKIKEQNVKKPIQTDTPEENESKPTNIENPLYNNNKDTGVSSKDVIIDFEDNIDENRLNDNDQDLQNKKTFIENIKKGENEIANIDTEMDGLMNDFILNVVDIKPQDIFIRTKFIELINQLQDDSEIVQSLKSIKESIGALVNAIKEQKKRNLDILFTQIKVNIKNQDSDSFTQAFVSIEDIIIRFSLKYKTIIEDYINALLKMDDELQIIEDTKELDKSMVVILNSVDNNLGSTVIHLLENNLINGNSDEKNGYMKKIGNFLMSSANGTGNFLMSSANRTGNFLMSSANGTKDFLNNSINKPIEDYYDKLNDGKTSNVAIENFISGDSNNLFHAITVNDYNYSSTEDLLKLMMTDPALVKKTYTKIDLVDSKKNVGEKALGAAVSGVNENTLNSKYSVQDKAVKPSAKTAPKTVDINNGNYTDRKEK